GGVCGIRTGGGQSLIPTFNFGTAKGQSPRAGLAPLRSISRSSAEVHSRGALRLSLCRSRHIRPNRPVVGASCGGPVLSASQPRGFPARERDVFHWEWLRRLTALARAERIAEQTDCSTQPCSSNQ